MVGAASTFRLGRFDLWRDTLATRFGASFFFRLIFWAVASPSASLAAEYRQIQVVKMCKLIKHRKQYGYEVPLILTFFFGLIVWISESFGRQTAAAGEGVRVTRTGVAPILIPGHAPFRRMTSAWKTRKLANIKKHNFFVKFGLQHISIQNSDEHILASSFRSHLCVDQPSRSCGSGLVVTTSTAAEVPGHQHSYGFFVNTIHERCTTARA